MVENHGICMIFYAKPQFRYNVIRVAHFSGIQESHKITNFEKFAGARLFVRVGEGQILKKMEFYVIFKSPLIGGRKTHLRASPVGTSFGPKSAPSPKGFKNQ